MARRALRYVDGQTLVLPIVMHDSCIDVPCDERRTCINGGKCVPATIVDPSRCATPGGCDESTLGDGAGGDGGAGDGGDASLDAGSDAPGPDAGPSSETPSPLALGYKHTCVVSSGAVKCFGDNTTGQLAKDPVTVENSPTPLTIASTNGADAVWTRESTTCARVGTAVTCWARSDKHQTDVTAAVKQPGIIAAMSGARNVGPGYLHTCWVAGGDAKCWGAAPGASPATAKADGTIDVTPNAASRSDVVQIASGEKFSCARTTAGKVFCWGANDEMQANGVSVSGTIAPPAEIDLGAQAAVQIGAGAYFACALLQSGTVKCWGNNEFKQLGRRVDPGPRAGVGDVELASGVLSGVQRIAVGNSFACAVLAARDLWCWGLNEQGQLGRNDPGGPLTSSTPAPVTGLVDVEHAAAGAFHACAITRAGKLRCWGQGVDGQIGQIVNESRVPVDVTLP